MRLRAPALVALAAAGLWAVAFAVWAYAGTAERSCVSVDNGPETCESHPLVEDLGPELLLVLAPAAVSVAVWMLLRRGARGAATALVAVLGVFCIVSGFSVGLLLLPVAALLAVGVAVTRPRLEPPAAA